jgi:protein O-GlcNAc transferase
LYDNATATPWRDTRPDRALRVGFVSSDLRAHPVGHFLVGWVRYLIQANFELYAYVSQQENDSVTEALRPAFAVWRDARAFSDQQLASRIRADGIDILLDLSGHTYANRLLVFASRAAPVQASYLGYFATTGVRQMDYIIANRFLVPPEEARLYSEKPAYLPGCHLCFSPREADYPVTPLPALSAGNMTFGCFNRLEKLTPAVLDTWAQILALIPNSTLVLKFGAAQGDESREWLRGAMRNRGVPAERCRIEPSGSRADYFAAISGVDVMLDPFPFNGATTTLDALWMGVPVLSLKGQGYVSHMGESILTPLGLADWVAQSVEDYVDKAVAIASDLQTLAAMRANLRTRLSESSLMNAEAFASGFSTTLRSMWHAFCEGTTVAPNLGS